MNIKTKTPIAFVLSIVFSFLSKAYGQTPAIAESVPAPTGDIISGIWRQAINNPSSFFAIGFLMVVAWLCDDLPWPPSKYVKHVTVIIGMATYWLFANPETVSKIYPHPLAIYACIGAMCGAVAYIAHWQIVARVMSFFQTKADLKTQTQNP